MSSLDTFIIVARDQEAMIQMKVEDNSTPEVCKAVRSDLAKLRTFQMEYDIAIGKGRLPGVFARQYGVQVAPYVMLRDPNMNEIEVKVEKKNGRVYFTDGWSMLQNFYDIRAGCWMTVVFANRNLFLIRLMDLYGDEVFYPPHNPPLRLTLQNGAAAFPSVACAPHVLFLPTSFYHCYAKTLTKDDVMSGKLKLGWLGFCQSAFPAQECQMTVVDYLGYSWKCLLKLNLTTDMTCSLAGDWRKICKARKFKIGDTVKLGVIAQSNNTVIYMLPPPMMVLRTDLPASKESCLSGHVFTVEQYFWMN